jgi:hypothetical protein
MGIPGLKVEMGGKWKQHSRVENPQQNVDSVSCQPHLHSLIQGESKVIPVLQMAWRCIKVRHHKSTQLFGGGTTPDTMQQGFLYFMVYLLLLNFSV